MNPLIKPDEVMSPPPTDEGFQIPKWAWGAAAGGAVVVSGAAVTIYHFISRRFRMAQARENVLAIIHDQAITPRGDAHSLPVTVSMPFDETPPSDASAQIISPPVAVTEVEQKEEKPIRTFHPKKGEVVI